MFMNQQTLSKNFNNYNNPEFKCHVKYFFYSYQYQRIGATEFVQEVGNSKKKRKKKRF